jgi:DNA polymerase III epsilon subunit-like protein
MHYELYVVDTETTGLSYIKNEPIEISIYRLSTNEQKTWYIKPINFDTIEQSSLRINGIKLEDLKGLTKEGKDKYLPPEKVLPEIENWLNEDDLPTSHRLMVGHNISFDKQMMMSLWEKCGAKDSFPFSDKYSIDTMIIEFVIDHCKGSYAEGYNLNALTKKYGIKNEKAHSASEDVKATVGAFLKQIEYLSSKLK